MLSDRRSRIFIQPSRLQGIVKISGAKNSALRLMAASLLTSEEVRITNYPAKILDAQIHTGMLTALGKECRVADEAIIISETGNGLEPILQWSGRSIRNTLLILGALVARTGYGAVPQPGGCQIGVRKYDLHEMVLNKLGAKVWTADNMLYAKAANGLTGADIHLPLRSTGATENAIICGVMAEGITSLWNPHIRPEIIDLVNFLNSMGADIKVYGQEHIEIKGVGSLTGTTHRVIPDNMEAITWVIASLVTSGDIEILDFPYEHLEVPMIYLRESGAKFFKGDNSLIVRGGCCYPVELSTGPYPGINSDMQPLFAVFAACARGESKIIDLRFPGRYEYTKELVKMGFKCNIEGNMLKIFGGNSFYGSHVEATDLRAGAALVLAGLIAKGDTIIKEAWQVERGYNGFVDKLKSLGGKIIYEHEE